MTHHAQYSFTIWDGKSQGSHKNIQRALRNNKKIKVFYTKENRFLNHEELDEKSIENIYKSNTGYTLTELVNTIKSSNIYTTIHKTSDLKNWLINHKMLKEQNKTLEINRQYENYFIVETYKGAQSIKYKRDILTLIESNSIFGLMK
jgi:hypothetical protein